MNRGFVTSPLPSLPLIQTLCFPAQTRQNLRGWLRLLTTRPTGLQSRGKSPLCFARTSSVSSLSLVCSFNLSLGDNRVTDQASDSTVAGRNKTATFLRIFASFFFILSELASTNAPPICPSSCLRCREGVADDSWDPSHLLGQRGHQVSICHRPILQGRQDPRLKGNHRSAVLKTDPCRAWAGATKLRLFCA